MNLERIKTIAVVAGVFFCAFIVLYSIKESGPRKSRKAYTAAGTDIALDAELFFPELKKGQLDPYQVTKICGYDGNCVGQKFEGTLTPHHLWRILGYAMGYKLSNDERFKNLALAEAKRVEYLVEHPGANEEMDRMVVGVGLWQLSEAYKIFKDPLYLKLICTGADDMLFRAEQEFDVNYPDGVHVPMIHAVTARQLALFSQLLEDPDVLTYIKDNEALFKLTEIKSSQIPAYRTRLHQQSRKILSAADAALSRLPQVLTDMPEFRDNACWVRLGELELGKASGNPNLKSGVEAFFRKANLSKRDPLTTSLQVFQDVAACTDVLQRLCEGDATFCADKDQLVKNFVVKAWDSPKAARCNGDGGFMSMVRLSDDDWCNDNVKAASDAGYGIFLLSKEKQQLDVYY